MFRGQGFACLLIAVVSSAAAQPEISALDQTLSFVQTAVRGAYDNRHQTRSEEADNVPVSERHRTMHQLFVPVNMPNITGYTVYQQSSIDGSTNPELVVRNGVLQFFRDPATNSVRERELNFKDRLAFRNAHEAPARLAALTLADFDWDPGCDFLLKPDPGGASVSGPIGVCQRPMPGGGVMTADDEVVISADEFWFLGRYRNENGDIVWGNASDEHVKLRRVATLEQVLGTSDAP